MHRDIHIQNIVLHFPKLEPNEQELNNISKYLREKDKKLNRLIMNLGHLNFEDFQIKFIDFGLSKQLEKDQITMTPVGVPEIIPPEMEKAKQNVQFDRRVDVWNTGVFFYMLLFKNLMFKQVRDKKGRMRYLKDEWSI